MMVQKCISINQKFQSKHYPAGAMLEKKLPIPKKIKNLLMYFCTGGGQLFFITKRAMMKKDYKELDEAIKAKVTPFLYNNGEGALIPIAQMACIRNRDRSKKKWVSILQKNSNYWNTAVLSAWWS